MTAGTDKSCGECGLCCKLLSAPSLGKPPRKWCVHFRRGRGCDIYADERGLRLGEPDTPVKARRT